MDGDIVRGLILKLLRSVAQEILTYKMTLIFKTNFMQ